MTRVLIVGSGIVGLAIARELAMHGDEVIVLEKEPDLAMHQTGRNSGVIHSGLYYTPGSAKAKMCTDGAQSMRLYAEQKSVAHQIIGKLVVATSESQIPQLNMLSARAAANGVPARRISAQEAKEYEPHVKAVAALRVETDGIIDYVGVCRAIANEILEFGGAIRYNESFVSAREDSSGVVVKTDCGELRVDVLINCAGLFSDRVARASGFSPTVRVVPFRGEYFELRPERSFLVRGLIYPVPDPSFPFLGVHLTKMVDGSVHAGPNAVLALAREGYRWRDINVRDLAETLRWPGLWRLGVANIAPGLKEVARSASRALFARSLSELVDGITAEDLIPVKAGVRAQALNRDGSLVDDFLIERSSRQIHVLNAPSPAATAAFEIARSIAEQVRELQS